MPKAKSSRVSRPRHVRKANHLTKSSVLSPVLLPQMSNTVQFTAHNRWFLTPAAQTAYTITINDLLNMYSMITTASTTAFRCCQAVRLRRIRLLIQPNTSYSVATVNLVVNPNSGTQFGSKEKVYAMTAVGDLGSSLEIAISPSEFVGQWFTTSTSPLTTPIMTFYNGNAGIAQSTIFIDLWTQHEVANPLTSATASAVNAPSQVVSAAAILGANAGLILMPSLDAATSAAPLIQPLAYGRLN